MRRSLIQMLAPTSVGAVIDPRRPGVAGDRLGRAVVFLLLRMAWDLPARRWSRTRRRESSLSTATASAEIFLAGPP